jgi:hypothetical protein
VLFTRGDQAPDASRITRSVVITEAEELWSFYFRVPKFEGDQAHTTYAVVAELDGLRQPAAAIWRFNGESLELGSQAAPVRLIYPVGHATQEDDGAGGFRLVVRYEVMVYNNNYTDLPECGFVRPDRPMPAKVDGSRSAKRL